MTIPKSIHLAAFLIAGNAAHSQVLWRHPQSQPGGFLTLDYYKRIAQTLERGKFDLLFFAVGWLYRHVSAAIIAMALPMAIRTRRAWIRCRCWVRLRR